MTYFFSATTLCFYPAPMLGEYKDLPDDLIEVGEDVFIKYHPNNQPKDKVRGSDEKGMPCWIDAPPLTQDQGQESVKYQKESLSKTAENKIKILERAVKLKIQTQEEENELEQWEEYTVLLNRVQPSDYPDINWPDIPISEKKES